MMNSSMLLRDRRLAFTLVEVLIVVAIMGVLASLLLPALVSARDSANSAKCLGNLRTLCLAHQSYLADNDGWIIQDNSAGTVAPVWAMKLAPYLNMAATNVAFGLSLQCPVTYAAYAKNGVPPNTIHRTSYGINVCLSQPGGGVSSPFKLVALKSPSQLILFADHGPIGWQDLVTPWNLSWTSTNGLFAHAKGTRQNAVFLDGHAASLSRDDGKFHEGQSPSYPWTENGIWWPTSN